MMRLKALVETRSPWIAALVMLLAALATQTSDPIGVFNDDGIYLLSAKAIAEGQGYVYPQIPGTPAAIHYPPLWSALLAVVWKVAPTFPASVPWFKLLNPLILAAAAALLVRMLRREFGFTPLAALVVTLVGCVSIPLLILGNLLLSEPLFLLLVLIALPLTEDAVREGGMKRTLLAAVAAGALLLTRTLGGVIAIAALLLFARRGRWKEFATYAAVTALLVLPWQLFVARGTQGFPVEISGSYGPYLAWAVEGYRVQGWDFAVANLVANLTLAWRMVTALVAPYGGAAVRTLMGALALAVLGLGVRSLWRADRGRVMLLALGGYVVAVLAWPVPVDRFLWIVWPLLVAIGARGLTYAWEAEARPRLLTRGARTLAVLFAGGLVAHIAIGASAGRITYSSGEMAAMGIAFARQVNEDRRLDGKVIASDLAPLVALYSGAQVLPIDLLIPGEHLHQKSIAERAAEIERVDRRFRPAAYIVMRGGPFHLAIRAAALDSGRVPVEASPPGTPVLTFLIQAP